MGPKVKGRGKKKVVSKRGKKGEDGAEEKDEVHIPTPPVVSEKTTTLLYSICTSDTATVNRLVAHYNFEESLVKRDINGSTALTLAVKRGDENMVAQLLSFPGMRSIINATEKSIIGGYAAIHLACIGGFDSIAALLIRAGSLLNMKSDSNLGETPLHCATLVDCRQQACRHGEQSEGYAQLKR